MSDHDISSSKTLKLLFKLFFDRLFTKGAISHNKLKNGLKLYSYLNKLNSIVIFIFIILST